MTLDGRGRGIVVWREGRAFMAAYRPTVWLVLQDVALDAEWRDGQLVAATSARLVAEHLRVDPGTAASALRILRQAGLVELGQTSGPDGRFGLAAYTVHLPDGIETVALKSTAPRTGEPRTVNPHTVNPHTTSGAVEGGLVLTCPWNGEPPSSPPEHDLPSVTAAGEAPPWSPPTVDSLLRLNSPDGPEAPPAASSSPTRARRSIAAKGSVEQGAFDLGTDP